jgi:hypothetical protein
MSLYDISPIKLGKGYGAMQKGIKEAYLKKLCHMLRHVKIKRCIPKKVCHMPTRHVKKKREKNRREKDSPYPKKKKKKQEGDDSYKGVHPSSTKNILPHTCTS